MKGNDGKGGYAFPSQNLLQPGMALRDYFAAAVVQGLGLAICIAKADMLSPEEMAPIAYRVADAMLKERER